jgi:signal transduction histidine kinase
MLGRGRSLRATIILILAVVVLVYAAVDAAVQRFIVYPSFERLEEQSAERDLERVREAFASELAHLELRGWDWTRLAEVTALVDGRSTRKSPLDTQVLAQNRVHLLMVCGEGGQVLWGGTTLDPGAELPEHARFRDFPMERLAASHPLLSQLPVGGREVISGLMKTEHGAMLVCARRFVTPTGSQGAVLMGRLLSPAYVSGLARQTGVAFHLRPVEDPPSEVDARRFFEEATATGLPVLRAIDPEVLEASLSLVDLQHAPIAVIEAQLDRAIARRGTRAMQYALSSTLAAGLLMMLVLLFLLQRAVLKPIDMLTQHAVEVGRTDALSRRLDSARTDELGVLAREFDSMVAKLAASRAELLQTARAAGMSEIATGVLHNVGNVLNSVNVSATLMSQQVAQSGAEDLRRVVETVRRSGVPLDQFVTSDPRGKHLDPLLEQIAEQLIREREVARRELGSLKTGLEHIQELIASQQSVASRSGVLEVVQLRSECQRAIELTQPASGVQGPKIEVLVPDECLVRIDRHRVMQILINLVQNARQSLLAAGGAAPRLEVRLDWVTEDRLTLSVEDNGLGIAQDNLRRIFTHGFTTRRDGHGFGLHSCANAAAEMGGRLNAFSAGLGQGARFVLEIPALRTAPHSKEAAA